jgi:hypothetical protein
MIPIGTFIQKMADQSKAPIRTPPTIGPPPNPKPATVAQMPIAEARRSGGNASTRIESGEWREQRGTHALQRAERDQHLLARRERTPDREHREAGEAAEEDPPAPVPVAEGSTDQDERRERQHVCVDDPDEASGRDPELALDRRERDVERRDV